MMRDELLDAIYDEVSAKDTCIEDAVVSLVEEIDRLRRILAAMREPSQKVVEATAEALYLRGDLSKWCTWENEIARYKETYYEDAVPLIRAAVAAAEQEVNNANA